MTRDHTITRNTSAGGQEEERRTESEISKKTFIGSAGAALTVLMLMLFATVSMNAVTAAFSPGIGGIEAEFGELNYDDQTNGGSVPGPAHIYPTTTYDTAACQGSGGAGGGVPVLTADIPGDVNVTGLSINKTVNTTGNVATMTGIYNMQISIQAAQNQYVDLSQPTLEFSGLDAGWLNLSSGVRIYENYSDGSASDEYLSDDGEFHVNASHLQMKNATAYAHLIGFSSINLPDQELSMNFNVNNSTAAYTSCDL